MIQKNIALLILAFSIFVAVIIWAVVTQQTSEQDRRAVCVISDQFDRVKATIQSFRDKGNWKGPVVLITSEEAAEHHKFSDEELELYNKIVRLPMIKPEETSLSRCGRKLFQQFKINMFHPILSKYDVILYADAGCTAHRDINPIFEVEPWAGHFCANSDSFGSWKFSCQFEHKEGDPEIPYANEDYFQTTFCIFDAKAFCKSETIQNLMKLFKKYPNHLNNEQSIMNIYFHDVWKPLAASKVQKDQEGFSTFEFSFSSHARISKY